MDASRPVQYNMRSPAVKRILQEAKQVIEDPSPDFRATPLDDDIFEWHFTIRGPPDTDFAEGVYHGRIILPAEYPMKPPSIILLTPSGRFQTNVKICLSVTGHHPEYWLPAWGVRTVCLALISFLPTKGDGAIGALDHTPQERRALALRSHSFHCPTCRSKPHMTLPPRAKGDDLQAPSKADRDALEGFSANFVYESDKSKSTDAAEATSGNAPAAAGEASASSVASASSSTLAAMVAARRDSERSLAAGESTPSPALSESESEDLKLKPAPEGVGARRSSGPAVPSSSWSLSPAPAPASSGAAPSSSAAAIATVAQGPPPQSALAKASEVLVLALIVLLLAMFINFLGS